MGKRKIARNEQFLLSHKVFYPFGELSIIFIKFEIFCLQTLSVWKCLKSVVLERVNNCLEDGFWKYFEMENIKNTGIKIICVRLEPKEAFLEHYVYSTTKSRLLTTLQENPFENIVGKGENAGNQHFLFFPQCFLPFPKQISIFDSHLNGSVVRVSDSWPGGCEFDPLLKWLFFLAYFRLSSLQKHVRKVVGCFGKKSCVSTGVRKPGNTYSSPIAMIWP